MDQQLLCTASDVCHLLYAACFDGGGETCGALRLVPFDVTWICDDLALHEDDPLVLNDHGLLLDELDGTGHDVRQPYLVRPQASHAPVRGKSCRPP